MSFTGVLVNTGTVLAGSLLGLLFKKGIPEKVSRAVMIALGIGTYVVVAALEYRKIRSIPMEEALKGVE